jgi:hypothetical protein
MTGEITLRGDVLPIGGLKEKVLAAKLAGIHTVIIPKLNHRDLTEVPEAIKKGLGFHFVEHMEEVLELALLAPVAIASPTGADAAKRQVQAPATARPIKTPATARPIKMPATARRIKPQPPARPIKPPATARPIKPPATARPIKPPPPARQIKPRSTARRIKPPPTAAR